MFALEEITGEDLCRTLQNIKDPQGNPVYPPERCNALVPLINEINRRDLSLTSLEILEPNLESVFLHLTGKKLRE